MNRALRILFWADEFYPMVGGLETWAYELTHQLVENGHQVLVVANKNNDAFADTEEINGLLLRRYPIWKVLAKQNAGDLIRLAHKIHNDVHRFEANCIHLNTCSVSAVVYLLSLVRLDIPVLMTLHGRWPETATRKYSILNKTIESANRVACVSKSVENWIADCFPDQSSKLLTLPNAITHKVPPPTDTLITRSLVLVARLSWEKGVDLALRAFKLVLNLVPEAHLDIAGDGLDRALLEELSVELGVNNAVRFLGWVTPENINQLMQQSKVVLIPSREEGFGLVALEAAMAVRPVVAFRTGGLAEIVQHEKTGLLIPPEDIGSMANGIIALLDQPDLASRMGLAAQIHVEECYSWDAHVGRYEQNYYQLLESKKLVCNHEGDS
ncbi:MAG: glycosyltransferase involved in cell wall biosynthesis [Parasphingorhabdus sp.]|jgi:glycosyltransferase involved in cell wall biosynthesis